MEPQLIFYWNGEENLPEGFLHGRPPSLTLTPVPERPPKA